MLDTGDTKIGETLSIISKKSSLGGGTNIHTVTNIVGFFSRFVSNIEANLY